MKKLVLVLLIIVSVNSFAQTVSSLGSKGRKITIVVTGFKTNSGKLKIALYDSKQYFLIKITERKNAPIKNYEATVTFENIPEVTYAISCYHDDNDNDSLDKNGYGMPIEPYAFSNNAKGYMGPASWEDAKFKLAGENIKMILKL